jgi:hypothetical protein
MSVESSKETKPKKSAKRPPRKPPRRNTLAPKIDTRLRVIFRGLCLFKFGTYDPRTKTYDYVKVLLTDARKPEDLIKYDAEDPVLPHIPVISIPKVLSDQDETKTSIYKYKVGDDYIFPLTKYIIVITDGNGNEFSLGVTKESDFAHLIPNLKDLIKAKYPTADIDLNVLDRKKLEKLCGYLELKGGTIGIPSSQNPDPRRASELVKTQFELLPPPPPPPIVPVDPIVVPAQLFSNCVYWEVKVPVDANGKYPFKIMIYEKDDQAGGKVLVKAFDLRLAEDDKKNILAGHIFITNMPSNEIEVTNYYQGRLDPDFALAYKVLDTPIYEPLPRKIVDPDEQETVRPLICLLSSFE